MRAEDVEAALVGTPYSLERGGAATLADALSRAAKADPAQERKLLDQFKGIGEVGEAFATAAAFFAFAEEQVPAEVDGLGAPAESVTVGKMGADLRQFAFRKIREEFVDVIGQRELKNSVAEELEALIVAEIVRTPFMGERWVGQRFLQ